MEAGAILFLKELTVSVLLKKKQSSTQNRLKTSFRTWQPNPLFWSETEYDTAAILVT